MVLAVLLCVSLCSHFPRKLGNDLQRALKCKSRVLMEYFNLHIVKECVYFVEITLISVDCLGNSGAFRNAASGEPVNVLYTITAQNELTGR